jgi:hypothetical protein
MWVGNAGFLQFPPSRVATYDRIHKPVEVLLELWVSPEFLPSCRVIEQLISGPNVGVFISAAKETENVVGNFFGFLLAHLVTSFCLPLNIPSEVAPAVHLDSVPPQSRGFSVFLV